MLALRRPSRWVRRSAYLYTVLETLKLHGKDPAAYLHAATLAADRGSVLLPWQFSAVA